MLKHLVWLSFFSFFSFGCSIDKEEGLFPGTRITGDPMADALVLSVLATPPCQYLTNENANVPFILGDGPLSLCSVSAVSGSVSVQSGGTYEVTATTGRQTLTSSSCNSSRFDFIVFLKEGNTELFSSSLSSKQIVLEGGKLYSLQSTGLVNPSDYQCQGRPVSSAITPYRINFRKL